MKIKKCVILLGLPLLFTSVLSGCGNDKKSNVTQIEIVQYKPEAASYFEELEKEFNESHDDIHLSIESPNDATTILKTRFIREDYPDIIGIGGDINYSYYVDAGILTDLSDYPQMENINKAYIDINEALELVPTDGIYGIPYVANAAGVLYNKDIFAKNNWSIPTNWSEFVSLCEDMQKKDVQPLYFGFKDTWTCLAPWNAVAVDLSPADTAKKVNKSETTFKKEYKETAEKYLEMLKYGPNQAFAYGYNDACTAFANGESAMYTIGSYAIPQILSVNPDLNLGSFVMPANDSSDGNTLNSGIDLQFSVTESCENKEAAYEVLDYLYEVENLQKYIDNQIAIPCKTGDFELSPMLDDMKPYIESSNMTDFQDHYYPSEMAVDAQLQTFLLEKDVEKFLNRFDKDWKRYNRDIIRMVQEYESDNKDEE